MKNLDLNTTDISVDLKIRYSVDPSQDSSSDNHEFEFCSSVFLEDAMRLLNLFLINPVFSVDYFNISNFQLNQKINSNEK